MSIYDTTPKHPAVRREQENDLRREGFRTERGIEKAHARRDRQQCRATKGTAYRNCLDLPKEGLSAFAYRDRWFHFTNQMTAYKDGIWHDENGQWYHTDEVQCEIYGPFDSKAKAHESMKRYFYVLAHGPDGVD